MINVRVFGTISEELISTQTSESMESILENTIADAIKTEIIKNMEDISFLEIKSDDSIPGAIKWDAKMFVCAEEQIISSIQIMSQRLAEKFKASAKDIEYCLEPMVTDLKGF